mgnify:CR=1 FL=1
MKVLAVSSPGGHSVQLRAAIQRLNWCTVHIVEASNQPKTMSELKDFSAQSFWHIFSNVFRSWKIIKQTSPEVVISTGAAPGFVVIFVGHLMGKHTIWIDSLANARKISLSGRLVRPFCNLHLSQWDHLKSDKTEFKGRLI